MAAYAADPTTPPFSSSISLSHSSIEAERLLIERRHEFLLLLTRGERLRLSATPGGHDRSEIGDAGSRHRLCTLFPSSRPSPSQSVCHAAKNPTEISRSQGFGPSINSKASPLPTGQTRDSSTGQRAEALDQRLARRIGGSPRARFNSKA